VEIITDGLELVLRDGTPIILRPLIEEDRKLVAEAYRRLSPEARYHRFWTHTGEMIGKEMLDRLVEQNPDNHMTWTILNPALEFPGLGGASWWRNPRDPAEAEVSIMVMNDHQRRGIGTLLLAAMWVSAFRAGVERIVAYTLLENRQAARWMRDCGGAGEWDGYKLIFRWDLDDFDALPENPAAADLASWLAELSDRLL
jgi:RimJ/RimL family protein N-acetyltransferase